MKPSRVRVQDLSELAWSSSFLWAPCLLSICSAALNGLSVVLRGFEDSRLKDFVPPSFRDYIERESDRTCEKFWHSIDKMKSSGAYEKEVEERC